MKHLAVLLAAVAVAVTGLAEPLELRLLDLQFRALRQWHPRPAAEVAVVGIDEDTARSLGERPSPAQLKTFAAAIGAGRAASLHLEAAPLAPDRDGVVRRYGDGFIDYSRGAAFDYVPFHRVLEWHAREEVNNLQREFAGKPVLLGRVLPHADAHAAPVPLALWETGSARVPGVLLHAQARRGLLAPLPGVLAIAAVLLWFVPVRLALVPCVLLAAASAWLITRGWVFPLGTALVIAVLAVAARLATRPSSSRPASSAPS